MRKLFALCVHEGFISLKIDATNAYANLPPPDHPTYMFVDNQYAKWYLHRHGIAVSCDMVLPVQHALQGHPKSGALWKEFVNTVIARHGFKSTSHESTLSHGTYKGHCMLICRQVDDLAIGCANTEEAIRDFITIFCNNHGIELRDEGILASLMVLMSRKRTAISKSRVSRTLISSCWHTTGGLPPARVIQTRSPLNLLQHRQHNKCSTIM
jgi:hypothetical protein